MQKIAPCLWFDTQAEEAARFYTSIFKNSRILDISHYAEGMPMPAGTVLMVRFALDGQEFLALNGGPQFKFTEAISLVVHCDTQAEIDDTWARLCDGGQEVECGWLKDRYGLCWQVVPTIISQLIGGSDSQRTQRVMQALFGMKKLNIAELKRAYES